MVTVCAPAVAPGCRGSTHRRATEQLRKATAVGCGAAGLGRAVVPHLLAERDLAEGRVIATGEAVPSRMGYWLVAPLPQWRQQKVRALVEALGG